MSKRPSATYNDPGYFYNQKRLLKLFTFSAIAMLAGILGMIWVDFDRPWKDIQRDNMKWEARKMATESFILETRAQKERGRLENERAKAAKKVAAADAELDQLEKDIDEARGAFYLADMNYKEQKQYTIQAEYQIHEAKDPVALAYWRRKYDEAVSTENRLFDARHLADQKLKTLGNRRKEILKVLNDVADERRADRDLRRLDLLAANIEKKRSYSPLREIPLLDFLAPPTKIEQVVLDHLVDDYEFARPKKVDRCATCHVGSFRLGFSKAKFPSPDELTPAKFEEAVYRFVFDAIDAVTPPVKEKDHVADREKLRKVEIHHQTLEMMFRDYDREYGTIGIDDKKQKIWKQWARNKKGKWVAVKKGGKSIANYFLTVLKDADPLYRTHPHFDDMVGSQSPHPYESTGCTICHLGRGWSTDFGYAWHAPHRKRVDDWMTDERAEEEGRHLPLNKKFTLDEAMAAGEAPTEEGNVHVGWVLDHDQAEQWKKLGRTEHKLKDWDWPQHSPELVESSCLKCHKVGMLRSPKAPYADARIGKPDPNAPVMFAWKDNALEFNGTERDNPTRMFIPEEPAPYRARRLEAGLDDFEVFGCYGCHKIDTSKYPWVQNLRPKVGPPLDEIATKAPKEWARKWVRNPKDFRADTRMPRFWGLANNAQHWEHIFADGNRHEVDGEAWNATEVYAIVEWIYDESTPRARKYRPVDLSKADPKRGEAIVTADYHKSKSSAKACIACHDIEVSNPDLQYDADKMADWTDPRDGKQRGWKQRMSRRQGPTLRGIASKVTPEWLYAWLKNPRGYWKHTNMPNLRLTDQEAKDVVAYLMQLRNEEFEKLPPVAADQNHILLMATELKVGEQKESTSEAISIVKKWTPRQRTLYVGKKLVKHYGCFGCHQIEAYKNETPIGTELTEWGSKFIERLEFNHAPIDHTRFDFAYTKLRNPRLYDLGMPRASRPYERLRMPRFGFTADEARNLGTFLIALVDQPIPPAGRFNPDKAQKDIIRGRQIVRRYNCQGCHLIENEGGDVFPVIEQEKWRPPNLIGQGIKTQPQWLFHFLKDPHFVSIPGKPGTDRIRPWHSIRMPTFSLTDEEARSLVRYFAALAGGPTDFETRLPDSLEAVGTYPQSKTLEYPAPDGSGKTIRARATNAVEEARALLDAAQCLKCHSQSATLENAAPSFRHVRSGRLRGRWLQPWLWGPGRVMPGTSMPGFFTKEEDGRNVPAVQLPQFFSASPDRQIEALADYIRNHYSIEEDR